METRICPPTEENLRLAGEILRAGGLVGMPTETVYGLAADATNPKPAPPSFGAKAGPRTTRSSSTSATFPSSPASCARCPSARRSSFPPFGPGP